MVNRTTILVVLFLLVAGCAWGRVLVRWTEPQVPPASRLGIKELVVSPGSEALIQSALDQGYSLYAEISSPDALPAILTSKESKFAGVIVNAGDAEESQLEDQLHRLKSSLPGLSIRILDSRGKQPEMRGQIVTKTRGILHVSSATAQPWVNSNLAMIRLERIFRPDQKPIYDFHWNLPDPLQKEQGPETADYLLAAAEAGAFRGDLILNLHQKLQQRLLLNDSTASETWDQIRRYLDFYPDEQEKGITPDANVGVVIGDYQDSYEPINLLARHNIPFRLFRAGDVKPERLKGLSVLIAFVQPDAHLAAAIADFAAAGNAAVLVDCHSIYPWQKGKPVSEGEHSVAYAVGKGRVLELSQPVLDPETLAQDIRRLIPKDKIELSLWNALTTVAISYGKSRSAEKVIELVNYAEEPVPVQVQVKGFFSSIRYESPENGCCKSLSPVHRGGNTEFVVPALRIAGRVHLSGKKVAPAKGSQ